MEIHLCTAHDAEKNGEDGGRGDLKGRCGQEPAQHRRTCWAERGLAQLRPSLSSVLCQVCCNASLAGGRTEIRGVMVPPRCATRAVSLPQSPIAKSRPAARAPSSENAFQCLMTKLWPCRKHCPAITGQAAEMLRRAAGGSNQGLNSAVQLLGGNALCRTSRKDHKLETSNLMTFDVAVEPFLM
jgi:hypothetical protein